MKNKIIALFLLLLLLISSVYAIGFFDMDFNNDNLINLADVSMISQRIVQGTYESKYDLNSDGKLDLRDIVIIAKNFGKSAQIKSYDVVVVGAGTGGVAAAIQAARMGVSVALLEETDYIGGQMTAAGVTSMDENYFISANPSGIYKEFIDRVKTSYNNQGKSIGTCYWSSTTRCFEPHIGQQILRSMISASGVDLFERTSVTAVTKTGNIVTGVKTDGGIIFNSKVLIDATEYGDLVKLSGAAYRVGNSLSTTGINTNSCVQDITYTAIFKKYPNGVPAGLVMKNPPPGYNDSVAGFRSIVTKTGNAVWNGNYPVNWAVHNAYRGMPDSTNPQSYTGEQASLITKTGVNWANDYPYTVAALENKDTRKTVNCEAKLKTLQFLYYVQTELGENLWSVANDEGYNTAYNLQNLCDNIPAEFKEIEKYMPVIPYVRESIRIVPVANTLTAKELYYDSAKWPPRAEVFFQSSLAVGDYGIDLHGCNSPATLETLDSVSDTSHSIGRAFEVPFESFILQTIDGFLPAEKNIGQSRLASGATRLQPSTMNTGQAAGAIAATAVKKNIQPRQVNYKEVQQSLLDSKAILYPFTDVKPADPFFKQIETIALSGIMSGYADLTFGGKDGLTRAQAAVVLANAFKWSLITPATASFSDVPTTHWAYSAIETIKANGITTGCGNGMYCPDTILSRAEMAVFIIRAMNEQPKSPCLGYSGGYFADVPTSYWACGWIEKAKDLGIMVGDGTNFRPDDGITREETAVVIYNYLTTSANQAPANQIGNLYVASTPTGAGVYLNTVKQQGTTPLTVSGLAAGSYRVNVTKPSYNDNITTQAITTGQTTTLSVILTPAQTCTNDCSSGQTQCSGSYLQTCGNYDTDPCLEWNAGTPCANGCSGGACITSCTAGWTCKSSTQEAIQAASCRLIDVLPTCTSCLGGSCGGSYVTRAQAAVILVNTFGWSTTTPCSTPFTDVPADSTCPYIEKIRAMGITSGCGNGMYCPDRNLTRAEMAVFIIRAMNEQPKPTCLGYSGGYFADVSTTYWACGWIEKAKDLGLMVGDGTNFRPDDGITKAETAITINNYLTR